MKFKGFRATYLYNENIRENDTIEIECNKVEVTYRNGQLGLFDNNNNLLATIEPTLYPDEPYRIIYPDAEYVDDDESRRLLYKFEII